MTTREALAATIALAAREKSRVANMSLDARVERLVRCSEHLADRRSELIETAVQHTRSTRKWATQQVDSSIARLASFAERMRLIEPEELVAEGGRGLLVREPYGVVGLVTPSNSPYRSLVFTCADALAAGNAVVARPSRSVYPAAAMVVELLRKEWGDAVHVVSPPGDVAASEFASNPNINVICVFASVGVGMKYLSAYGEWLLESSRAGDHARGGLLKKFVLELSGNDPLVVLPGADLELAAHSTATGSFPNSGQSCICAKRILVHREIADRFKPTLVREVAKLKVGDPADPAVDIGPLTKQSSYDDAREHLKDALARGAEILCGGKCYDADRTIEPTVVVLSKDGLLGRAHAEKPILWTRECFGPVRALVVFDTADEAVELAADTSYGLGAALFGPVPDCLAIARRIETGRVIINRDPVKVSSAYVPVGGVRNSGLYGATHRIRELTYQRVLFDVSGPR